MRVLLIFLDGVGVGPNDPAINPFAAAPPPHITELLARKRATLRPLDALLGVDGLPQSGTGQFSLLTGLNGARLFGRHYGPWVPTGLRAQLQQDNVLRAARAAGYAVTFANSYPEELLEAAWANGEFTAVGPLRAGPPLAAAGAGVLTRHTPELEQGAALSSEIVNDGWRDKLNRTSLPRIDARTAGHNLAALSAAHDLTFFAHYTTDQAGHEQDLGQAIDALQRVDQFIGGAVERLGDDVLTLIVSDHGNLEDVTMGHTRNPALALLIGPDHQTRSAELNSLLDVKTAVLRWLSLEPTSRL